MFEGFGFYTISTASKIVVLFLFLFVFLDGIKLNVLIFTMLFIMYMLMLNFRGDAELSETINLVFSLMLLQQLKNNKSFNYKASNLNALIFCVLLLLSLYLPLFFSTKFTYYGTTARGEFRSVLDIAVICCTLIIANYILNGKLALNVLALLILYVLIPSRTILVFIAILIAISNAGLKYKIILLSLAMLAVSYQIMQNEYFYSKMIKLFNGEEQRFNAIFCGFDIISSFSNSEHLIGGNMLRNYCLPGARLIEMDFIDIYIRYGILALIFVSFQVLSTLRYGLVIASILLYGMVFGHVLFNPLALFPLVLAISIKGKKHE